MLAAAKMLEQLPGLVLGWLFGLLGPPIVDRIRRKYRAAELSAAIAADLHELQFTMATVAFVVSDHLGSMSDEFLAWLEPTLRNYNGSEAEARPRMVKTIEDLRKIAAGDRRRILLANRKPMTGLNLKEYGIPLLAANVNELSILPIPFQAAVLRIKGHLDLFNQDVVLLRKYFERTFDSSLSEENRRAVESNLEQGYESLVKRARLIADGISRIPRR